MTAKEAIQEILDQSPKDASYEDIIYNIYLREKIERGLRDAENGNFVSDQELDARLGKWDIK